MFFTLVKIINMPTKLFLPEKNMIGKVKNEFTIKATLNKILTAVLVP